MTEATGNGRQVLHEILFDLQLVIDGVPGGNIAICPGTFYNRVSHPQF